LHEVDICHKLSDQEAGQDRQLPLFGDEAEMEQDESPMISGWPSGGRGDRSEVAVGTVVVPLADVVPADIEDPGATHSPAAGTARGATEARAIDLEERVWRWTIVVEGTCTRSCTTPTDRRRDALLSATRFVEAAKRIVRSEPTHVTGSVAHAPKESRVPNDMAGQFVLHLELRDADPATVGRVYERIAAEGWTIGRLSQTKLTITPEESNPSVVYDMRVQSLALSPSSYSPTTARASALEAEEPEPAHGLRIG
jgi:hypothetical protein